MKNYDDVRRHYLSGMRTLGKAAPEPVTAFTKLVEVSSQDGALSTKSKELIAFAIAIAARCEGCIAHHAHAVLKADATRQEVVEMITVALFMGGGPSSVYGVEALEAYDEFSRDVT